MKINFFISILVLLLLSSCHKENNDQNTFPYRAEVIGSNLDCGVFSIKFTSEMDKVQMITGGFTMGDIYIARNLPVELQQSGINIRLDIRKIQDSELGMCTAMGPSYPWLYVIRALKE